MKRFAATLILLILLINLIPAAPAAAAGTCGTTYTVKRGDTLWSIAKKCSVAWTVLLGINYQIDDPSALQIGQVIRMEAETKIPTDNPVDKGSPHLYDGRAPGIQEDGTYLVRDGDSLARIAEIYQTSISELRRLNPSIGPDNIIYPGQSLVLPPGSADLPGGAQLDGFVGINTLQVSRGKTYAVNVTNFPPFADIDVRLMKVGATAPARIYDGLTDAVGNAFINVTIPYTAYPNEKWVVQVITTELYEVREGFSAEITIIN